MKKYYWNLILAFVLLLQWTMPPMKKGKDILINFSDITFEKCQVPEHSHPPLSQRATSEDPEKNLNSELKCSFISNGFRKYVNFNVDNIFENQLNYPELIFNQFPLVRGPPYLEV